MREKNRLLILTHDSRLYVDLINKHHFIDLDLETCDTSEKAKIRIKDCHIILGVPKLIEPVLQDAKKLQWIQSTYAGVEALLSPPKRTDYILTGVKDIFGPLMSEYVFAYILALERNILEIYENQKKRAWQDIPYISLQGRLIGICGLGSIGRHIANTASHFGMKVWGYRRSHEGVPEVDRIFTKAEFGEFLAHPDYIVNTLPATPDTFHLIDYNSFKAMKGSAVLINVGRGNVVSEKELVVALEENLIRGAVLDVFEDEPLPQTSRLWEIPNVLITPHNSAYSFPEDIVNIFAENYRRFVEGKELMYTVDFSRGY